MKRLIIKILYKFFIFFNFKKFFFLRVLMFHDIDEKDFSKFENLLKNLKKKYKIVDPKKLNTLSGKNNVLLTFDDGFLSSYQFSKKVLDKHKIKSLFFLVSDLLKNKNNDKIIKRISGEKNKLRLRKFLEEKHVKHI